MQLKNVMLAAAVTFVDAQRPKDQSICDYYTTALLKTNNATNQATLLTLLVNTVVIGNCKSLLPHFNLPSWALIRAYRHHA